MSLVAVFTYPVQLSTFVMSGALKPPTRLRKKRAAVDAARYLRKMLPPRSNLFRSTQSGIVLYLQNVGDAINILHTLACIG